MNVRLNQRSHKFMGNLMYAFIAQIVALILSIIMSLLLPKVLGLGEYSYWQLFLFYSNYVGIFLLGLNDGMYLRFGGKKYEDLNHELIGSQLKIFVVTQILISSIIILISWNILDDQNRKFILILTATYIPIFNVSGFFGSIFQAVNRTKVYSISTIIDKVIFIACILIFLVLKIYDFKYYVIFYILSKLCSFLYCCYQGRRLLLSKLSNTANLINETYTNISVGIKLMFSNFASMLVLGSGRLVIDNIWSVITFGKLSFALSLTNFVLQFIGQISMVLFPALRESNEKELVNFYNMSRVILGVLLSGILLLYIPIKSILGLWLPKYRESLEYLALLLPLCTFDGKMNMLCNTYFKVLRKEKFLMIINFFVLGLSIVLSTFGGYVIKNLYFVIISMVISVAIRSIISEVFLSKLMNSFVTIDLIFECFLSIIFVFCSYFINGFVSFFIYLFFYLIYLFYQKDKLKSIIIKLFNLSYK